MMRCPLNKKWIIGLLAASTLATSFLSFGKEGIATSIEQVLGSERSAVMAEEVVQTPSNTLSTANTSLAQKYPDLILITSAKKQDARERAFLKSVVNRVDLEKLENMAKLQAELKKQEEAARAAALAAEEKAKAEAQAAALAAAQKASTPAKTTKTSTPAPVKAPAPAPAPAPADSTSTYNFLAQVEKDILTVTNRYRQQAGLPPLKWDNTLYSSARDHSKTMFVTNNFSHTTKYAVAENIYMLASSDQSKHTAEYIVGKWMASAGHRANILDPRVTIMGAGVLTGKQYFSQYDRSLLTIYATQHFR